MRLITGAIGSGKTNLAVDYLLNDAGYKGRPIYSHGIRWHPGKQIGTTVYCRSQACPFCKGFDDSTKTLFVDDWFNWAEPNAVIFVDECHYIWPQRPHTKAVPESVQRLRDSRHDKIEFLLVTQHPMFLDVDVRRILREHVHCYRNAFTRMVVTSHQYMSDPEKDFTAEKKPKALNKKNFKIYISAEQGVDNFQKSRPVKIVLGLSAVVLFFGLAFYLGSSLLSDNVVTRTRDDIAAASQPLPMSTPGSVDVNTSPAPRGAGPVYDPDEILRLRDYRPRIPYVPESAPRYDGLHQMLAPVEPPRLSGCMRRGDTCKCYDQTGRHFDSTPQFCAAVLRDGVKL